MKIYRTLVTGSFLLISNLIFCQNNQLPATIIGGLPAGQFPAVQSMLSCTPLFSFDTPDLGEMGLAGDGSYLWVGGGYGSGFYKCDASGTTVQIIPMPPNPTGGDIDFDGTHLWHINEQSGKLFQIDPLNGNIINQYFLPNNNLINPLDPNPWGLACDDSCIWEMEYITNFPNSYTSILYKLSYTAVTIDSFVVPHWILPLELINGELWGTAFDVPFIYKIDKATGLFTDSIPRCATMSYGLTTNNSGFWVIGQITSAIGSVHLFESMTGIGNLHAETEHITIYPQPANDILNIKFNAGHQQLKAELFSITGKLIKTVLLRPESGEFILPLDGLAPGSYTLRIISETTTAVSTFLKM